MIPKLNEYIQQRAIDLKETIEMIPAFLLPYMDFKTENHYEESNDSWCQIITPFIPDRFKSEVRRQFLCEGFLTNEQKLLAIHLLSEKNDTTS